MGKRRLRRAESLVAGVEAVGRVCFGLLSGRDWAELDWLSVGWRICLHLQSGEVL